MGLVEFILQKQQEMMTLYEHELFGDELIVDIFGQIIERVEELLEDNIINKMNLTVFVGKNIQNLLTDDEYYRKHWVKDYEQTLFSKNFSIDGKEYNVLVMYCTGSRDGNGWISISYWQMIDELLHEIADSVVFEDGDIGVYKINSTKITVTIKFEEE